MVAPVRDAVRTGLDLLPPSSNPRAAPEVPGVPFRIVTPVPSTAATTNLLAPDAGKPEIVDAGSSAPDAQAYAPLPYQGPWFAALLPQASVFSAPEWAREKRIGYLRRGNRAPVERHPVRTSPSCEGGWYRLLGGGFVCAKQGTIDMDHPQIKAGPAAPNIEEILPYKYGWNTTMGTPLYRTVPSRDEMAKNEPYLQLPAQASSVSQSASAPTPRVPRAASVDLSENTAAGLDREALGLDKSVFASPNSNANANANANATLAATENRRWWQQPEGGAKPELKLADLVEEDNALVARRLVRGFYIAIDKSFSWNGRTWFETTSSLVAPADRFAVTKPATVHGLDLSGTEPARAGFILASKARKYRLMGDPPNRRVSADGPVDRFTTVLLTNEVAELGGVVYRQTTEGWWMKGIDGTYTDPGPPPEDLSGSEKWIDVNLSRQTLVAFEGARPVFASLVSSGKHARVQGDKAHDHRTVQGSFRIREKHITTTMDGDGAAPGDMPYSIEDVPYVMYFEGSYALHAAFWHTNFGHEQSHGCVNLAPLDAKRLFGWSDPQVPEGWHAVFSSKERPGTRVVIHE